ncbi:hypothetical protein I6H67_04105 [Pediococcus pentosaceus]|uniref:hypothetical protein n=1 Tax=Pediococcus pentosaceus TaxID=1255 RepID=UPI0018E1A075|nr:hypothetical protein [Pediococcus pentosaceus]MBF7104629.1 hypothetical protein [Pediococcus pentosaceus]QQC62041.1 hypothetical protein I6H67_04105 [Pediococcus pentosaceus]
MDLHLIFGFSIAEWGTLLAIAGAVASALNKILKDNVKTPLENVKTEITILKDTEAKKHEKTNERIGKVEERVSVLESKEKK